MRWRLATCRQAIEHFTAIIDQDPDFAEGWNARATAFYQAGEFGPSVADIAQVLTAEPAPFRGAVRSGDDSGRNRQAGKGAGGLPAALAIHPHLEGVIEAVERLETQAEGQEL